MMAAVGQVSQGFKVDELLKELLGLDLVDSWMIPARKLASMVRIIGL